ncbi:hypothetical protein QOT17_010456 [Balamuthia mandrillaris]
MSFAKFNLPSTRTSVERKKQASNQRAASSSSARVTPLLPPSSPPIPQQKRPLPSFKPFKLRLSTSSSALTSTTTIEEEEEDDDGEKDEEEQVDTFSNSPQADDEQHNNAACETEEIDLCHTATPSNNEREVITIHDSETAPSCVDDEGGEETYAELSSEEDKDSLMDWLGEEDHHHQPKASSSTWLKVKRRTEYSSEEEEAEEEEEEEDGQNKQRKRKRGIGKGGAGGNKALMAKKKREEILRGGLSTQQMRELFRGKPLEHEREPQRRPWGEEHGQEEGAEEKEIEREKDAEETEEEEERLQQQHRQKEQRQEEEASVIELTQPPPALLRAKQKKNHTIVTTPTSVATTTTHKQTQNTPPKKSPSKKRASLSLSSSSPSSSTFHAPPIISSVVHHHYISHCPTPAVSPASSSTIVASSSSSLPFVLHPYHHATSFLVPTSSNPTTNISYLYSTNETKPQNKQVANKLSLANATVSSSASASMHSTPTFVPLFRDFYFITTGLPPTVSNKTSDASPNSAAAILARRHLSESQVTALILAHGGQFCKNFFEKLALAPPSRFLSKTDKRKKQIKEGGEDETDDTLPHRTRMLLISKGHHRTFKYLACVAWGVPCLHYRWVLHSCEQGKLLPQQPYLLPVGFSLETNSLLYHNREEAEAGKTFAEYKIGLLGSATFIKCWGVILKIGGAQEVLPLSNIAQLSLEASRELDCIVWDDKAQLEGGSPALVQKRHSSISFVSIQWLIQSLFSRKALPLNGHASFSPSPVATTKKKKESQ